MSEPLSILKKYWGYDQFRPLQEDIIQSVIKGKPTLALLPTGGGKSICFQVPAMVMDGICIVISPLIALMKDQVEQLRKRNIKAVAVYSGISRKEIDMMLDNCIYGDVKFLYVSPERIKTELFLERAKQMNISLVAIDEAHCISQWGYDFRPSYLEINHFLTAFEIKRIIALTASATKEVREDILSKLLMEDAQVFKKSFARSNLSYSVFQLERKEQKMLEILKNVPGTSVVYVRSRKQTKDISDFLQRNQVSADYYHAGLIGSVRAHKQEQWIANKIRVMVATNAFGMGIDKPDVRTVIHYDLPDSLEAYYQEAGRAGRDEKKAYAIQLFNEQDLINLETRTEKSTVTLDFMKRVYQALANFYKLAVGSNAYSSFEFDYQVFIQNFNLPVVETYHALNKLSDEGLIQLNDSYKEPSRLIFLLSQEEVYKYQVANQALDPVIKALLRLYGGELFSSYVQIKEQDLAGLLRESVEQAVNQLEYLSSAEVIDYQHRSDKPQLTFLTERYDINDLPVDQAQIAWRRKVTHEKVKTVISYVTNEKVCRTRFIQEYFDEQTDANCGVCDVCLNRTKKANISSAELLKFIASQERTEEEIVHAFKSAPRDEIMEQLRILMDRSEIYLTKQEHFKKT